MPDAHARSPLAPARDTALTAARLAATGSPGAFTAATADPSAPKP
ncbi:hypothetical protein [Streptomyces sp. NRRL F-4489]|nr:hypothetical protein [Streptomyces sp. NRRL F-4489]